MTPAQAERCFRTQEHVLTADGRAVVVAALYSEADEPPTLALVWPEDRWLPIAELTASEDRATR